MIIKNIKYRKRHEKTWIKPSSVFKETHTSVVKITTYKLLFIPIYKSTEIERTNI